MRNPARIVVRSHNLQHDAAPTLGVCVCVCDTILFGPCYLFERIHTNNNHHIDMAIEQVNERTRRGKRTIVVLAGTCCLLILVAAVKPSEAACSRDVSTNELMGRYQHRQAAANSGSGGGRIGGVPILDWLCALHPTVMRCLYLAYVERFQEYVEGGCCKQVATRCSASISCQFYKICSKDTRPCAGDTGNGTSNANSNGVDDHRQWTGARMEARILGELPPQLLELFESERREEEESEMDVM